MNMRNVEIFRTGTHTDSAGRTKTWTGEDLAEIAGSYLPTNYEAPNVIGHPASAAPAWGWVERLRVVGDRLLADLKDVPEEFVKMVRAKRFKKRSISLFTDGRLRHVGWLGAAAPAVSGLKDFEFSSGEAAQEYNFEFSGGEAAQEYNFEDAGPTPQNVEEEEMKTELEKLKAELAAMRGELAQVKDGQVAEAFRVRLESMDRLVTELAARTETAEAETKKAQEERDKTAQEFSKFKDEQVAATREARFEALVTAGKVVPAEKDKVMSFAAALAQDTTTMDFAAPDGKAEKLLKEEIFWRELEGRGGHSLFRDFQAPAGATTQGPPTNLMTKV